MLHVAFVGTFTASLEQPVRRHLTVPCEIVVASEADILPRLPEIDVLVTMGFTAEMARAAARLKLVQVPTPSSPTTITPACGVSITKHPPSSSLNSRDTTRTPGLSRAR